MDLNEALQRIFYAHRRSIVLLVAMGVIGGVVLASLGAPSYTAAARITIGDRPAEDAADPVSMADAAEAIATSRSVLAAAVQGAGSQAEAVVVEPGDVSVKPLGSSEFLQLEVTAGGAATASALANALAEEVVQRWSEVGGSQGGEALALVNETLDRVLEDTASLDEEITLLGLRMDQAGTSSELDRLQARREALIGQREALERQRVSLEAQLSAVLVETASRSAPQVIDPAVPPLSANSRHMVPMAVLGGLLGFLLGAGAAGLIEAVSPTLVGAPAVGDALGVPVLGTLVRPSDRDSEGSRRAVVRARLAAARVKVTALELVPVGRSIDLEPLASSIEGLDDPGDDDRAPARRVRGQLVVRVFGSDVLEGVTPSRASASSTALVAVAPSVVKRSSLREMHDAQAVTGWDIVGVIVYGHAESRSVRRLTLRERKAPARDLGLSPRAG